MLRICLRQVRNSVCSSFKLFSKGSRGLKSLTWETIYHELLEKEFVLLCQVRFSIIYTKFIFRLFHKAQKDLPVPFLFVSSNQKQYLNITCPGEGGDGAKGEGSAEASRQRGGGRLPLARTLLAVDELGQVRGQGGDEVVLQVRREQRRLAAEGGDCRATCKVSATQEQHNSLLPEITVLTKLSKV